MMVFTSFENFQKLVAVSLVALALGACGGGGGSDSGSGGGDGGGSSAGGGGECEQQFDDAFSGTERETANQCGTQATSQLQVADALRESAIANCEQGNIDAANEIYETQYLVQVQRTRDVLDAFCDGSGGGGGGGFEDTSDPDFWNLCTGIEEQNGTLFAEWKCEGGKTQTDNSCPSADTISFLTFTSKHSSKSECAAAGEQFFIDEGFQ